MRVECFRRLAELGCFNTKPVRLRREHLGTKEWNHGVHGVSWSFLSLVSLAGLGKGR